MQRIALANETDWHGWRQAARLLVLAGVEPNEVTWTIGGQGDALPEASGSFQLPRALVTLASIAIQARDPNRFDLLYSLVRRAHEGEKLLEDESDPDLWRARRLAFAVRADAHRMRTNMRFMPVADGGEPGSSASGGDGAREADPRYLGWFAPGHFVLPANAQLIARRFPDLVFSIITPDGSAHWDRSALRFGAGLRHAADDDALRTWWDAQREAVLAGAKEGASVPEAEGLSEVPRPPDLPALGPVVVPADPDPALADAARARPAPP